MAQRDMKQILEYFDEANRLWFSEGHTAKAIEMYKNTLRLSDGDPVIAFQLASALWLLGQKDEALHYLAIAEQQREVLGEKGRRRLDLLKRRLETETPKQTEDGRLGMDFDIERLAMTEPTKRDWSWFDVALDAETLGLYGVALAAYGLYPDRSLDPELLRDEENMRLKTEREWRLLKDMRREMRQ